MVAACLIATTLNWDGKKPKYDQEEPELAPDTYDSMDGPSEEEAYLQGMSVMMCLET